MACGNVGISRRQEVFVRLEGTCGTLATLSDAQFITPAGDAIMNQNPAFVDSLEKRDSRDVQDQFPNATPPGTYTIPMYVRPKGTLGQSLQGEALFTMLMGSYQAGDSVTATITGSHSNSIGTISLKASSIAGGKLPGGGHITIANGATTEDVYYTAMEYAAANATVYLTGLTRGHNSTTAATHATGATLTVKSASFVQAVSAPSASIWIKTDHTVQFMAGCTVNDASFEVNNEGAFMVTFSGEGMQMGWVGTTTVAATAAAAATQIKVTANDSKMYTAGGYIMNDTKDDDNNGGTLYQIDSVSSTGTISLVAGATLATSWNAGDTIAPYLPTATKVGEEIESRKTNVYLNKVAATIRNTTITFSEPKTYPVDQVGTEYPDFYMEDTRSISGSLNLYFKALNLRYFKDGYDGLEIPIWMRFGNGTVGKNFGIALSRSKVQVPTVSHEAPAVALSMPFTALGMVEEDSASLVVD